MNFRTILIAGAGTMGRGITELMALNSVEVQLWDHNPGQLGRASAALEKTLRKQVLLERISQQEFDETLGRIRLISDFRVVNAATNVVIETVIEDMAIKRAVLARIEEFLPDAWFATNTSSLSIEKIASALDRPERLVGLHFFNPALVMPLVEVVYSMRTDEQWLRRSREFVEKQLGKQTIVVKDSPGFASSRLSVLLALEAMRMFEQGVASAEDIDKSMEYGFRHPMGPLRQSDWMGLDVRLSIARVLHEELRNEAFRPPKILENLVAEGKLGKKTGEGFYKWPKEP